MSDKADASASNEEDDEKEQQHDADYVAWKKADDALLARYAEFNRKFEERYEVEYPKGGGVILHNRADFGGTLLGGDLAESEVLKKKNPMHYALERMKKDLDAGSTSSSSSRAPQAVAAPTTAQRTKRTFVKAIRRGCAHQAASAASSSSSKDPLRSFHTDDLYDASSSAVAMT